MTCPSSSPTLRRPFRAVGWQPACPILLCAMLAAFFFWPLPANLGLALHDRSDTLLNTWILGWQAHILVRQPWELFNAPIFYPLPNTLALSEVLWPDAPIAVPLLAATGNPVLVYNLLFLASFPLAGLGMYLLAGHVTGNRRAALLASVIYAFCPYQFGHLSQLQLITIGWLPMALLALDRFWARRDAHDGALLAFCVAAQTLSAFYYGFQVVLAIGLYLAVRLATSLCPRLLPPAREAAAGTRRGCVAPPSTSGARQAEAPGSRPRAEPEHQARAREVKGAWLPLAGWLAAAGLAVLPFALPYFSVHRASGSRRSLGEALAASPPLADFLLPHAANPLYQGLLRALHPGAPLSSGYLFLGVIPSALALAGCLGRRRPCGAGKGRAGTGARAGNRPAAQALEPVYWLLLFAMNTVLALGPRLKLVAGDAGGAPLPFGWLYEHLPGMTALPHARPLRHERLPGALRPGRDGLDAAVAPCGAARAWHLGPAREPGRLDRPVRAVLAGVCRRDGRIYGAGDAPARPAARRLRVAGTPGPRADRRVTPDVRHGQPTRGAPRGPKRPAGRRSELGLARLQPAALSVLRHGPLAAEPRRLQRLRATRAPAARPGAGRAAGAGLGDDAAPPGGEMDHRAQRPSRTHSSPAAPRSSATCWRTRRGWPTLSTSGLIGSTG